MAIHSGIEQITHNFRLSIARQRRSWFNFLNPERRYNLLISIVVVLAGAILYYLMGDLEGQPLRMAIGFVAGIIGAVVVARSPDMLIAVLFLLNTTIFGVGSWASLMLKFNVFETGEVVLGVLMVFTFWEYLRQGPRERPRFDAVLALTLLFYVIVLSRMLHAVFILGRVWEDVWTQYGRIAHYLLILPMVVYLRRTDRARTFLWVLFIGAFLGALQTYYFFFFGATGWGHLFGLVDVDVRGAGLAARLPNAMLMMGMTILCFCLYLHADDERKRKLYFLACLALLVAVAMNKGRNAYVGVMLAWAIAWVFAPRAAKWRAFRDTFWVTIVITTLAITIPPFGQKLVGIGENVGLRFMQTFDPYEYEEGGYRDRMREVEEAWPKFLDSPIFGQSPGSHLRITYEYSEIGTKRLVYQPYMHNSYVYLLATGGLLVGLALAAMVIAWLRANIKRLPRLRDPVAVGMAWGSITYVIATLASSWVQPNFFLTAPVTATAVIVGLADALGRKDLEEQRRVAAENGAA